MRKTRPKRGPSREPQLEAFQQQQSQPPTDLLPWPRASEDLFESSSDHVQHQQRHSLADLGAGGGGGLELPSSGIPDYTSNDVLDLFRRFIDLPSEDESDDPDFRPQDAGGEEDEWVAESDTASGDEEVVVAHSMTSDAPGTSPTYQTGLSSSHNNNILHFQLDPTYWSSENSAMLPPTALPSNPHSSTHSRAPFSSSSSNHDIALQPYAPQPQQQQQQKLQQGEQTTATAPTNASLESESAKPVESVKRGRGRPKKQPKPDEDAASSALSEPPAKKAAPQPRKVIPPEDRHRIKLERNKAGVQRRKLKAQEDAQRVGLLEEQNQALLLRNQELEQQLIKFGIAPPAFSPATALVGDRATHTAARREAL